MEEIIRLEDVIATLKKGWKLIVIITIICTLIAGSISYFLIKPKYDATIKLFIGKQTGTIGSEQNATGYDSSEVNMYQNLMGTYAQIITTTNSIGNALEEIGMNNSINNINSIIKNLKVEQSKDTQILTITYTSTDKAEVVPVLNAVTNIFISQSKKLIPNGKVNIIETPAQPQKPISPNKTLNIIIGFIIGLILSVGIILILDYFDNTVKSTDELEKLLDYPVIGAIPEIKE